MNKSAFTRFSYSGAAIGVGVGAARCASLGPTLGILMGLGLAMGFGLSTERKC
jgi:hypothetical protein